MGGGQSKTEIDNIPFVRSSPSLKTAQQLLEFCISQKVQYAIDPRSTFLINALILFFSQIEFDDYNREHNLLENAKAGEKVMIVFKFLKL